MLTVYGVVVIIGRYNASRDLPRGFIWQEGDVEIHAQEWFSLVQQVGSARTKYGGDLAPGWELRVADDLCTNYTITGCGPKREVEQRSIHANDVFIFLKVVKAWVKSGGVIVSQEEADRRSEICSRCPKNVEVKGCNVCKNIIPHMFPSLAKKRSSLHDQIDGCGVCGCQLKLKVWIPAEVLTPSTSDPYAFPEECWVRQEVLASERDVQAASPDAL